MADLWLPTIDLLDHIGRRQAIRTTDRNHNVRLSPSSQIVDMLGYRRHTTTGNKWQRRIDRALSTGRIRLEYAEDLCDILGVHPTAIWGWAYFDACQDAADAVELATFDARVLEPPEDEPGGRFCGRHTDWRAIGHDQHYGLFGYP